MNTHMVSYAKNRRSVRNFCHPVRFYNSKKNEMFCKYLAVFLLNFDHSEHPISATYGEAWKLSKKQLNIYKKFHIFGIIEARGVAEISDRSTIFGL